MSVLKKILFARKNKIQFWFSVSGLFLGTLTTLMGIMLYIDLMNAGESNESVFGANSMILQKRVTRMTSMGLNSTGFTDTEVKSLLDNPAIKDLGTFLSANYEVGISENPGDGLPGFYANMFLQSAPDRFIKGVDSLNWSWSEASEFIPVILPKDFLILVNYGIAPSQGLPQVSEEFVKSVRLRLHMEGNRLKDVRLAKVVGFSSQINAVLVPESFINYSNDLYGHSKKSLPNRLFVVADEDNFSEIRNLIEEMNLDISESALGLGQLKAYAGNIIFFVLIFSLLILTMAILSLVQYFQMMIINLKAEIKVLLEIGYQPVIISRLVVFQLLKTVGVISLIALGVVLVIKLLLIQQLFLDNGITLGNESLIYGILFVILLILLFIFVIKIEIQRLILRISKD